MRVQPATGLEGKIQVSSRICALTLALIPLLSSCHFGLKAEYEAPFYKARKVFEEGEYGLQCHSSTIAQVADGDLMAAWWSGSYEGSIDAAILGARLPPGQERWEKATVLADIPGRFEGNPVLFSLPDGRLWLFFALVETQPSRAIQIMFQESEDSGRTWSPVRKFVTSIGIRPRNHPILMENGEILFPVFDQLSGRSLFLISADLGESWESTPPVQSEFFNIQPTVIQRSDGSLYALMRTWNDDPGKRFLWQSESIDHGRTWAAATLSEIPAVDSAVEMVRLKNGHLVLAYHDGQGRERTPLNLALSTDEGRTWEKICILEDGPGSFSYPSITQSKDGHIHVTYSYNRNYIKHLEINEPWIDICARKP